MSGISEYQSSLNALIREIEWVKIRLTFKYGNRIAEKWNSNGRDKSGARKSPSNND